MSEYNFGGFSVEPRNIHRCGVLHLVKFNPVSKVVQFLRGRLGRV